jgi:hypothetical protein
MTKSQTGKIENLEIVGVVDTVFRFRGLVSLRETNVDIADLQYHPFPDSAFASKFENTFTDLKCISSQISNPDENLSNFEISMAEDDLSNIDLMPPPLFSQTVIPQLYKYLPAILLI